PQAETLGANERTTSIHFPRREDPVRCTALPLPPAPPAEPPPPLRVRRDPVSLHATPTPPQEQHAEATTLPREDRLPALAPRTGVLLAHRPVSSRDSDPDPPVSPLTAEVRRGRVQPK